MALQVQATKVTLIPLLLANPIRVRGGLRQVLPKNQVHQGRLPLLLANPTRVRGEANRVEDK